MNANLTPQTLIRQKPDLLTNALDQDLVLMRLDANRYFGMDPLSRRVWELFAEPRSIHSACQQLCAEFDVTPEQCEQDVTAFMGQLIDAQLVEIVAV
jgi:hypothetical protein